ncbi:MAG: 4-hydroxyphenylpyruvate dioxygenase, partial [Paracoccaceae bacterium]
MGPFPHSAAAEPISEENPAGTNGMEFVEFAHEDPDQLRILFTSMGFSKTADHKIRAIELWQQGDITYVLNNEPGSMGMQFVAEHGPCAPSMAWRVTDADYAYIRALEKGAEPYDAD